MTIPTFVDLQGFIVGKKFIVKEITVLRKGGGKEDSFLSP